MIIGTGVDIVKIERFDAKQSPRFMQRVFSVQEQGYLSAKGPQSMAGLFAAKEAAAKALGTGFTGFSPCDIEVTHDKMGKPHIILHGKAEDAAKKAANGRLFQMHISISHTATDAVAFAVLEAV
ncbi:MAG: holo-ACP synthase [Defluviitaleaceae bacterium]|nr:holo-ACP synthase [Defluviitaleaceae bacterium]